MQWKQVMMSVKVLSPEMTDVGLADGFNGPAGNSALCEKKASIMNRPGILGRVELYSGIVW